MSLKLSAENFIGKTCLELQSVIAMRKTFH
jgi:hypothetical protein